MGQSCMPTRMPDLTASNQRYALVRGRRGSVCGTGRYRVSRLGLGRGLRHRFLPGRTRPAVGPRRGPQLPAADRTALRSGKQVALVCHVPGVLRHSRTMRTVMCISFWSTGRLLVADSYAAVQAQRKSVGPDNRGNRDCVRMEHGNIGPGCRRGSRRHRRSWSTNWCGGVEGLALLIKVPVSECALSEQPGEDRHRRPRATCAQLPPVRRLRPEARPWRCVFSTSSAEPIRSLIQPRTHPRQSARDAS